MNQPLFDRPLQPSAHPIINVAWEKRIFYADVSSRPLISYLLSILIDCRYCGGSGLRTNHWANVASTANSSPPHTQLVLSHAKTFLCTQSVTLVMADGKTKTQIIWILIDNKFYRHSIPATTCTHQRLLVKANRTLYSITQHVHFTLWMIIFLWVPLHIYVHHELFIRPSVRRKSAFQYLLIILARIYHFPQPQTAIKTIGMNFSFHEGGGISRCIRITSRDGWQGKTHWPYQDGVYETDTYYSLIRPGPQPQIPLRPSAVHLTSPKPKLHV